MKIKLTVSKYSIDRIILNSVATIVFHYHYSDCLIYFPKKSLSIKTKNFHKQIRNIGKLRNMDREIQKLNEKYNDLKKEIES